MTDSVNFQIEQILQRAQNAEYFSDQKLSIESQISGGSVNRCWKLGCGDKFYLAKLSQQLPQEFLTHWQAEIELNQVAANSDLAPKAVWIDSDTLAAIYPWCGNPLSAAQLAPSILNELGNKISQLHLSESPAKNISYRKTIESYLSVVENSVRSEVRLLQLADLWDADTDIAFCHHDLNPGNILWDGQCCKLVDWEYARLAHPLFDLASISCHFSLSTDQLEMLLKAYRRRRYSIEDVYTAQTMVQGLERLWTEAAKLSIQG